VQPEVHLRPLKPYPSSCPSRVPCNVLHQCIEEQPCVMTLLNIQYFADDDDYEFYSLLEARGDS